jgi:hypothetical protein
VDDQVAIDGAKFRLVWAMEASGRMPARNFFLAQSDGDRAKLLALFKRLADFGLINNREKFKKLEGELWEFKSFQLRILGAFRPDGIFLLAHGVRKKKDEHSKADLEAARRILRGHDTREQTKQSQ